MLIDYEYNSKNKTLILSYIDKTGNIKLKYYPWSPTKYITTSLDDEERSGKYVTWDGKPVKQIYTSYPNKYSIYDFINDLPEEEQNVLFEYNEPNIFFIDIENEITTSKPRPHLAETKVLSISIVNKDKAIVIGIDPLTKKEQAAIQSDINNQYGELFNRNWEFKYIHYKTEYDMLLNFFKNLVPKMAVMTGWNFKHYDWVFLVNRARKLGIDPRLSSFTGKLERENEKDPKNFFEAPAHRVIIDYMEIFDKWDTSIKVKESIGLDFISEKVLKVKKVNYEGNLKILYETDFKKFIFYNAIDSILVQLIHEKTKTADILYGIATLCRTIVTKALSTLNITEGILRKKLKDQKNIVLVKNDQSDESSSSVKGGWVKEPVTGMASWTCCFDFASLYPTTMRQFNISADSYKGQKIKGKNLTLFNGQQIEIEPTDIITKNGSVFRAEDGVVTQTMAEVYANRKKYKKVMLEKKLELDELEKELIELEECLG
jgi:DNA polymerase elongation subunit (family B)